MAIVVWLQKQSNSSTYGWRRDATSTLLNHLASCTHQSLVVRNQASQDDACTLAHSPKRAMVNRYQDLGEGPSNTRSSPTPRLTPLTLSNLTRSVSGSAPGTTSGSPSLHPDDSISSISVPQTPIISRSGSLRTGGLSRTSSVSQTIPWDADKQKRFENRLATSSCY